MTDDIDWMEETIHKEVEEKGNNTSEWHYYISSKSLTAEELLKDAMTILMLDYVLEPCKILDILRQN